MRKRIVYTRHADGGVSICCPSDWAVTMMGCGGLWQDQPRGMADRQIASMVERGIREDVAARYANAVMFGGCTTAEALEIIRDRDCAPHGTGIELWDLSEVPRDRWFRDAWRRSHNGGPISIDLRLAKPIQFARIKTALAAENRRRAEDMDSFDALIEVDFLKLRESIRAVRDEIELRHIWPAQLRGLGPTASLRPAATAGGVPRPQARHQ